MELLLKNAIGEHSWITHGPGLWARGAIAPVKRQGSVAARRGSLVYS